MMNTWYRMAWLIPLWVLVMVAAAPGAEETPGTRISEAFDQPVGGLPADWATAVRGNKAVAQVSALPEVGAAPRNGLLLQRPAEGNHNAAVYYTGSHGAVTGGSMADVDASVTLTLQELGGSSSAGIVLRAQRQAYAKFGGYYVGIGGTAKKQGLGIYFDPENHVTNADTALAFAPAQLRPGVDYLLRVSARGATIEASLWTLSPTGEAQDQLASVTVDNAEQQSAGKFGLRGAYGNSGPIGAWFRDLHLEVIR